MIKIIKKKIEKQFSQKEETCVELSFDCHKMTQKQWVILSGNLKIRAN